MGFLFNRKDLAAVRGAELLIHGATLAAPLHATRTGGWAQFKCCTIGNLVIIGDCDFSISNRYLGHCITFDVGIGG